MFFFSVFPAHLIFEIFYCFGFKLDLSKIAQREFNHTLKLISTCFRKKKYRYHTISMTISMMREKKILNYLELAHKIPLDMFPCISDLKKKKRVKMSKNSDLIQVCDHSFLHVEEKWRISSLSAVSMTSPLK